MKPPSRRILSLWFLGAAALRAGSPVEVPSLSPQISSIFPHGGAAGSTVDVELRGSHLDRAARLVFPQPGIQADVVSSEFRLLRLRVRIAAGAETGEHEFRLFTPTGGAMGVFVVGSIAETREVEPNNSLAAAQQIQYPAVINGTADAADADYFRLEVRSGQTLSFDIDAVRSGSALDPVLAILDERGTEIAYCDDYYISKDAHIERTFSRGGTYYVRVTASFERSAPHAEYRLTVTDRAYPMYATPAGGQRGQTIDITVQGANLGEIDGAWVGAGRENGPTVLNRSPSRLKIRVKVPPDLAPGAHLLHLAAGEREAANPIRFEVSDMPEMTVPDGVASSPEQSVLLRAPILVNAEIGEHGSKYLARQHWFELEAAKGARYEFRVNSWELGLRLDPVVAVFDLSGRKLAFEDDPAPNSFIHYAASHDPRLVYRFPEAGRYRICVRDAMYRGGSGFIYRLAVRETQPDFSVDVHGPNVTALAGRRTTVLVQVRRTGGVHVIESFKHPGNEIENFRIRELDAWDTPISVSLEGLPPGAKSETAVAAPQNTLFKGNDGEELFVDGTLVELPIVVAGDAVPGFYRVRVTAEGHTDGRTLRHDARVLHTGRGRRGQPVEDGDLYLAIVQPPPVVLMPPAKLELTGGEPTHLKIGIFSFKQPAGPLVIEARQPGPGLTVGSVTPDAAASEVELPVSASAAATDSHLVLVLVAKDAGPAGKVVAESPPIAVEVTHRRREGAE